MVFLDKRSSLMVAIKGNEQAFVVVYNLEDDYFELRGVWVKACRNGNIRKLNSFEGFI